MENTWFSYTHDICVCFFFTSMVVYRFAIFIFLVKKGSAVFDGILHEDMMKIEHGYYSVYIYTYIIYMKMGYPPNPVIDAGAARRKMQFWGYILF